MAGNKEPLRLGMLLFNGFEILDAFGPAEAWNVLAHVRERSNIGVAPEKKYPITSVSVITRDGKPVNAGAPAPSLLGAAAAGQQSIIATHSIENCPPLDVLLIPGGLGAGPHLPPFEKDGKTVTGATVEVDAEIAFVRKIYPSLQYVITVCTGAGIAARAGILDGHKATTNKHGWSVMTALGPKTHWIAKARWVESGNIWTASGVSAGTDCTLAWMEKVYGEEMAKQVRIIMEYEGTRDSSNDPFAAIHGAEDVLPQK